MIRRTTLVLVLGLLALTGCEKIEKPKPEATPAPKWLTVDLQEGRDYVVIKDGAPFEPEAGKIEVAEAFGYICPHCAHFEPLLEAWRAKQPADVKFVAVPAPFGGWWMPYAKAYYAAEELGLVDKTHAAVFNAIHVEHTLPGEPNIATDQQIASFYARYGADAADFAKRMESAPVTEKLKRAGSWLERAGVDGTPTLVVDGKYRVTGASPEDTLRIAEALVARERTAH
ncbi:thiol:disulfide interchange protein DsbA/DsbL [Lysobacter sp. TY2-98]|uniref:thiol:disulfide interchange protein DsbA/DsbL n=1 Tax=Lysobacter sp. TY2-98 TaxID=2290922 RepID=UPI000E1FF576|nr:thiol:disulfide interchange protein DsbA/DsbL [Lysobacter sp. TY2-98]AXK70834.1 thiol:disulfide interchange protein DsbA/DsbL [Lysobacter sp. TY2-98]